MRAGDMCMSYIQLSLKNMTVSFGSIINILVSCEKRQTNILPSMFVEFDFVDGELWKDITENISKSQQTTTKGTVLFVELQTKKRKLSSIKEKERVQDEEELFVR
jgi:hypothetical protein